MHGGKLTPTQIIQLLVSATFRYVKLHRKLFGKYNGDLMRKPDDTVLKRVSGTFKEFLEREGLKDLLPTFLILNGAQGYGYLDEIGALYGLMWNTPEYLASEIIAMAPFKDEEYKLKKRKYKYYIWRQGYEDIWNTITRKENFDIKFNVSILEIVRRNSGIKMLYRDRLQKHVQMEFCDFLIWTPPMPDLLGVLSRKTPREMNLFGGLKSHVYTASLMRSKNTRRNSPITWYRENLIKKIDYSVTADMEIAGTLSLSPYFNISDYDRCTDRSRVTTVLHLSRDVPGKNHIQNVAKRFYMKNFEATDIEFLSTISWPYFYRWNNTDLENLNHWNVFSMQGQKRTWYAGASVSFESVKSVMEYNNLLIRQIGNSNIRLFKTSYFFL